MQFRPVTLLLVALVCGLGLSNCEPQAPAESRSAKIAAAYCECAAKLADLNQKVASLAADTTKKADLIEYFRKMELEYTKARECSATVVAQYGHLKPEELEAVDQVLQQKCPALAGHRDQLRELLGE